MFFTAEATIEKRRELLEQMRSGTLTRAETFQRAIELDPFDAIALRELAKERLEAGDRAAAAEYAWRAAEADPCRSEPWHILNNALQGENQPLVDGVMELSLTKTLRDAESFENLRAKLTGHPQLGAAQAEDVIGVLIAEAQRKRLEEPADVSERLRPHRLVDEVLDAVSGLDHELVDSIVEDGARCAPLLVGVLRATGSGSLPSGETRPAVASLAMLGEIGDPARLPEVIECATVDDDDIGKAADWAAFRIASRRPGDALAVLRKMTPGASAPERCVIASLLSRMRDLPGQVEALQDLLDGLGAFPKDERSDLFADATSALMIVAGAQGRELAWSLFRRYQDLLPKRARGELQESTEDSKVLSAAGHDLRQDFPHATVYDFCTGEFEDDEGHEEDDEDDHTPPQPAHRRIGLGRNDPCWCGSGKKYKKCHLEADEAATRAGASAEEPAPDAEAVLRRRLIDFSTETLGKRGMQQAMEAFLGEQMPEGSDQQSLAMEAVDWVIHDYVPPRLGHTLIEEFLKRSAGGLAEQERNMLSAWSRARFSLLEVRGVQPDAAVTVADLLAGGEFLVRDVNTAKRAAVGDTYLARVEETGDGWAFTAVVMTVPPHLIERLMVWAIREHELSGQPWDDFLHANSHKFRQEASRLIGEQPWPKRVVSAEGDELVFSKAHYEILDETALRHALDTSKAMIRDDDGHYGWVDEKEDDSGARRAFGHLEIAHGELILECQSRERLERGKDLLRHLAGAALHHQGDDFRGWKSALREH